MSLHKIQPRCKIIPFFLVALLLAMFPTPPAGAFNELVTGTFVDDGVAPLGRGGLERLPHSQEVLDFDAPLFLDSHGNYRFETGYENQRTVRIFSGRWSGSHAWSDRFETAVAIPFSLLDKKLKGNIAAGYGYGSSDALAQNTREDILVRSNENIQAKKGGLFLQAWERLSLGVAVIDTDLRNNIEIPIEVEARVFPFLKIGYKRSYMDFTNNIEVRLSGHNGNIPFKYNQEVNELYTILDYKDHIYVKFANDLQLDRNKRLEMKIKLPASLYVAGNYLRRDFADINQTIIADGNPGGFIKGTAHKKEYRIGIGADFNDHWNMEANYRRSELTTTGGGVASSKAVADFWPSLIIGNYNYLFDASLKADQYHIGTEYRGDAFSFAMGLQYIDLKPAAQLDYWRSLLFGLGKTGDDSLEMTIDRIQLLFLSLGIGYTWKNISLSYAIGQFIPLGTHDREPEEQTTPSTGAPADSGEGTNDRDIFSAAGKFINRNPGGNLQRLLLTIKF